MWKNIILLGLFITTAVWGKTMHEFKMKEIKGSELSLSQYKGKAVLAVNIATQCGYTKQLKGLEELYKKYKDKGLVVLGIPSNDFGGQTPEENTEVAKFCEFNYGVTFPLTQKVSVKGESKDPLAAWLISSQSNEEIAWNFEKFLINKDGQVVDRFKSAVDPMSLELTTAVEKEL